MKVVLGYSGWLYTSVIVPWLKETYQAEVICMAADVGQLGGLDGLEEKAIATGAAAFRGLDLREEFVEDFIFPTIRAGAVYSRKYLLGTAMARPAIAKAQVQVARDLGADALAHGCTGKGNDQVRFELTYAALAPDLDVIAPWRLWSICSREDALEYAGDRGIPIDTAGGKLYSRDENLWHISHEGGPLEDPAYRPEPSLFLWTQPPEEAPDAPVDLTVGFEEGVPVSLDGEYLGPLELLTAINEIGARHGIGRADIVEDRLVGMKSRGIYETPGGTILHTAHRELEQLTLDRRSLALKDQLAHTYADLVYEGRWWTPEREALDSLVDSLCRFVTGTVTLELFKGNAAVVSRSSPTSLYDEGLASFGESSYDHSDASGFIRLFSLPGKITADRDRALASPEGATPEPRVKALRPQVAPMSKVMGKGSSKPAHPMAKASGE